MPAPDEPEKPLGFSEPFFSSGYQADMPFISSIISLRKNRWVNIGVSMHFDCFRSATKYSKLKKCFKHGDIIYGLSIDTSSALDALSSVGFKRRENGKDNVLVQNSLTNSVFGPLPTPGVWRTNSDIYIDLNDGQRGVGFKYFSMNSSLFDGIDFKNESPEKLANKLWGRTSKLGILYQVVNRRKTVHFIVDNAFLALRYIVTKSGKEGRSVTAAEIRYIYRRRHLPLFRNNIRFYTENREIHFDEFFSHSLWLLYQPTSTYF